VYDINSIRGDFPILQQQIRGRQLVYFDNAATTHVPVQVMEAVKQYKEKFHANPHRGAHYLGVKATMLLEEARAKVAGFINAPTPEQIIFTRNATEALNLVAYSFGLSEVKEGQEIVVCISEHHSNLVPWQQVAKARGAVLRYLYLADDYSLDWQQVEEVITDKTAVVAIATMSNVLGTINPVKAVIDHAHRQGAVVVVDGAQSVSHLRTDVQALDADFFAFSGHKMYAPMGIGVLYGKRELLEKMPSFLTGGEMVEYVEEQDASFKAIPYRFEAGTPNVEGAVGLAAAIDYLHSLSWEAIYTHEHELTAYALNKLIEIPYVKIYGPTEAEGRGPVISFTLEGCHPHDVATIVDAEGAVALRAGHHCAQPLMKFLQAPATARVSFALYNTKEEIDQFITSLKLVRRWLGYES
jgi:cysteine desulfurase/selenocysteine lyase